MPSLLETLKRNSKLKVNLIEAQKETKPKKSTEIEAEDEYDYSLQQIKRDNPSLYRKIMRFE